MPDALPRLKPDPIPDIHPVPEHAAGGALAAVYDRTKRGLGVPWMGVVAMAFAHYPAFYNALWSGMEPVVRSAGFAHACQTLRGMAEQEAQLLDPFSIRPRLEDMGYGPQEIKDIQDCNSVFSNGNMPYLLMATLARQLLDGGDWHGPSDREDVRPVAVREPAPKPELMEPQHACADISALYADIRSTLGLPFVNTDYRAFARWPSYFKLAWGDLRPHLLHPTYAARVERVHNTAVSLLYDLPNLTGLTSDALIAAAQEDASLDEVQDVVRLFQWLLPGLVVNVAYFRAQLLT